jgi:hypothetical protein
MYYIVVPKNTYTRMDQAITAPSSACEHQFAPSSATVAILRVDGDCRLVWGESQQARTMAGDRKHVRQLGFLHFPRPWSEMSVS